MDIPIDLRLEIREYLDRHADFVDSPEGYESHQRPNQAMRLLSELDEQTHGTLK